MPEHYWSGMLVPEPWNASILENKMTINKLNAKKINTEVNIHDDDLISLNFERESKTIVLELREYFGKKRNNRIYFIKCNNVLGAYITSCVFWGAPECVLNLEYVSPEEQVMIPELKKEWLNLPNPVQKKSYDNYVEILFTFSSGDKLRVACESIEL